MNENSSIITALCSHLCSEGCSPLMPSEWAALADLLILQDYQPQHIPNMSDTEMKCLLNLNSEYINRIKRLLDRRNRLERELEKYRNIGICVVTRADTLYPKVLKNKLHGSCPPLFYYAGDLSLLSRRTVGFVGSRNIENYDIAFAENIVRKVSSNGFGVVSGGARGTDSVSAAASIANGGFCIEYICDSLARKLSYKMNPLRSGQLLVLSAALPDASFSAGMALQRNKFIYCQSEATVVVKSDYNKGGTWSGASDALRRGLCPVLCRNVPRYIGNMELIRRGAVPIDENWNGDIGFLFNNNANQITFI